MCKSFCGALWIQILCGILPVRIWWNGSDIISPPPSKSYLWPVGGCNAIRAAGEWRVCRDEEECVCVCVCGREEWEGSGRFVLQTSEPRAEAVSSLTILASRPQVLDTRWGEKSSTSFLRLFLTGSTTMTSIFSRTSRKVVMPMRFSSVWYDKENFVTAEADER